MAAKNWIPKYIEKSLFAEDLVGYVMTLHSIVHDLPNTAERYRSFVYNGFSDAIRRAVLFLCNERSRMLEDASVTNNSTYSMLMTREKDIRQLYFPNGFDVNQFLPYCVHLANLAAYFFKEGVRRAPSLAVTCIQSVLEEFDVTNGGWNALNRIAEKYKI